MFTLETQVRVKSIMDKIGNVTLDYTDYIGKDLYSDGSVEDELLEVVKEVHSSCFDKTISEKMSWPFIYHLSKDREHVLEWIPIDKEETVLEIGSGCGAITGALAKKSKSVTCVELSERRSLINANRNKEYDNITINVGNFENVEKRLGKFDVITLIGVLEYAGFYIDSKYPYEDFLKMLKSHLNENGRIIIAIENKFGLKYWAGCREDHVAKFFEGIEGYTKTKGIKTFSKLELEKMFKQSGFDKFDFFYPYPDYKLPYNIYSDQHLPVVGELTKNNNNYDADRLNLFNETHAFDEIIKDGKFDFFSNSYIAIVSCSDKERSYPSFVKYNRRSKETCLKTELFEDEEKTVKKSPMTDEAIKHIDALERIYNSLLKVYEGTAIVPNKLKRNGDILSFEFVNGSGLDILMDVEFEKKGIDGVVELINSYKEALKGNQNLVPFEGSDEFEMVFGKDTKTSLVDSSEDLLCLDKISNIDAIFSNIIVEDKWHMIDYEWSFEFLLPINFIVYRAVALYVTYVPKRNILIEQGIFEKLGISDTQLKIYRNMDASFYSYVLGSTCDFSPALKESCRVVDEKDTIVAGVGSSEVKVEILLADGNVIVKNIKKKKRMGACKLNLPISKDYSKITLYPTSSESIISNIEVYVEDEQLEQATAIDGKQLGNDEFLVFDNQGITISLNSYEGYLTCLFYANDNKSNIIKRLGKTDEFAQINSGVNNYNKQGKLGRTFKFTSVLWNSENTEDIKKSVKTVNKQLIGMTSKFEITNAQQLADIIAKSDDDTYLMLQKSGVLLKEDATYMLADLAYYRLKKLKQDSDFMYMDEKKYDWLPEDDNGYILKSEYSDGDIDKEQYFNNFIVVKNTLLKKVDLSKVTNERLIYDIAKQLADICKPVHLPNTYYYGKLDV